MKDLKSLSVISPAIGLIFMFATGVIGFYAGQAVADHDKSDIACPSIIRTLDGLKAQSDLIKQEMTLNQGRYQEDRLRSDRATDRILDALVRIEQKVDTQ